MSMEQLIEVFARLKQMLKEYEGPFTPKFDTDSKYDLWSVKDTIVDGRKRKEVYFAGLVVQRSYVGFYYMPVYADAEIKRVFEPELLGLLKGKSCFHIKQLDGKLEQQIRKALRAGFALYRKRGWV